MGDVEGRHLLKGLIDWGIKLRIPLIAGRNSVSFATRARSL